ncbi:MAG: multidrug efflux MFS transporter [Firmicutes bacterium]|nr:multidrug efflux MFS transporter [Bacillota bacterium]
MPLFVVVTGAFAAILNNTMINVGLPKLQVIFGVSTDQIQWVLTAFMLFSGMVIPVTGYLGRAFGVKRVYTVAVGFFALTSLLCAMAWSYGSLVAFRVLQGIAVGAIMPVSMTIIYQLVPPHRIGAALGVWGVSAMAAPAVGPTLGGYLVDHLGWHFLFLVNVPVGLFSALLAYLLLPPFPAQGRNSFDRAGFLFSVAGLFLLLLGLSQGHREGWGSYYIVMVLTAGAFLLALFVITELGRPDPMLNLRVLGHPVFALSVVVTTVMTVALFGAIFLMPLYCQLLRGYTPLQTGLLLMPSAIASALAMPLSGYLFDRYGPRYPAVVGALIATVGSFYLASLDLNSSWRHIQVITTFRGLGIGLAMMPVTTAGMNALPRQVAGEASAIVNTFRQVAASFGIACLSTLLQDREAYHRLILAEGLGAGTPGAFAVARVLSALGLGTATGTELLGRLVEQQAFVRAMQDTFLVAAWLGVVVVPLCFLVGGRGAPRPGAPVPTGRGE